MRGWWFIPACMAAFIMAGLLEALLLDGPLARASAWALLLAPLILCGRVLGKSLPLKKRGNRLNAAPVLSRAPPPERGSGPAAKSPPR